MRGLIDYYRIALCDNGMYLDTLTMALYYNNDNPLSSTIEIPIK
ncbi:hypothetical protein AB8U03_03230 [Clostridium sp. Mt-5]|uniref:Uncharacterized protein n=1 Tax=Clostridium moutaii TaxID=3240932 RepID=A0ABV4BNT6_9CLOT